MDWIGSMGGRVKWCMEEIEASVNPYRKPEGTFLSTWASLYCSNCSHRPCGSSPVMLLLWRLRSELNPWPPPPTKEKKKMWTESMAAADEGEEEDVNGIHGRYHWRGRRDKEVCMYCMEEDGRRRLRGRRDEEYEEEGFLFCVFWANSVKPQFVSFLLRFGPIIKEIDLNITK